MSGIRFQDIIVLESIREVNIFTCYDGYIFRVARLAGESNHFICNACLTSLCYEMV